MPLGGETGKNVKKGESVEKVEARAGFPLVKQGKMRYNTA